MKANLSSIQTKIIPIIFGLALFVVAFSAVKGIAYGNVTNVKMLAGMVIAIGVVLLLDKNYWMLCPILSVVPLKIPGMPFSSAELGCLALIGMFLLRSTMHMDRVTPLKKEVIFAVPYFFWVCVVWCLNPTGMHILGSNTIGGRFYFQIVLAFATLCVLSRIITSERQCKVIFWSIIIGNFIRVLFSMSSFGVDALQESIEQDAIAKYYLETFGNILLLLLCHYRIGEFIKLSWKFFVAVILFLTVTYAGRRTMMGQVLMSPFLLMFFKGKDKLKTMVIAFFACFILGFVLVGQGRVYELPYSMQRAMSFLPAKWDSRFDNYGTKDLFREELHKRAKERIKESPLFGRKGFSMDLRDTLWINSRDVGVNYDGHEFSGNWHNKFWGMGADFGLPASFAWYFFSISAVLICWKRRYWTKLGTYRNTLFLYYSLFMVFDLVFAFGHSALTPFGQWIKFAIIIALLNNNGEYSSRKVLK